MVKILHCSGLLVPWFFDRQNFEKPSYFDNLRNIPPPTRLHTMRTERQRMLIQLILTLATFIDTPGLRSPIFFSLCNFFLFVLFFLWFHWKRQICYMSINLVCSARPKKIKLPAWSEQQTEELHRIYDEMKTTIGNLYLYWFYK